MFFLLSGGKVSAAAAFSSETSARKTTFTSASRVWKSERWLTFVSVKTTFWQNISQKSRFKWGHLNVRFKASAGRHEEQPTCSKTKQIKLRWCSGECVCVCVCVCVLQHTDHQIWHFLCTCGKCWCDDESKDFTVFSQELFLRSCFKKLKTRSLIY